MLAKLYVPQIKIVDNEIMTKESVFPSSWSYVSKALSSQCEGLGLQSFYVSAVQLDLN